MLEKWSDRIYGKVISSTFQGKRDLRRQIMIWDALEKAFGPIGRDDGVRTDSGLHAG